MWLWILIGLCIITKVHGFSAGAPEEACTSMLPVHERSGVPAVPQNTEPPFKVTYELGQRKEPITVSLQSKSSEKFTGFMLEAREKGMVDGGNPVGKFILLEPDKTKLLWCSKLEDSAVSHNNNRQKTLIRVNWTAGGAELDIIFRATFVQSYFIFWERVDVNVVLPPDTTTLPPSTPISTPTSTPTSTPVSTQTSTPISTPTSTPTSTPVSTQTSTPVSTQTSTPTSIPSSTTKPSTTEPSTTPPVKDTHKKYLQAATVMMVFIILLVVVKEELSNILTITLTDSPFARRLIKVFKIICSQLCGALEISALVLFCVDDLFRVTLVALVSVAIVINTIELITFSLPIGPSHELKEICDLADKLCSVFHIICTTAVVFMGVLEIEDYRKKRKESWLLIVMIAYVVWIFLFVIWVFILNVYKNTKLGIRQLGRSHSVNRRRQRKKELSACKVIYVAVSVIFNIGTMSFTAAVIVGIFLG